MNHATLNVDPNAKFTPMQDQILWKTFKVCSTLLELAPKYDFEVNLTRHELENANTHGSTMRAKDNSNKFLVELNTTGFHMAGAVGTFCHEMLHVCQHLTGRLTISTDESHALWEGKTFSKEYVENPENYRKLPWEAAAFKYDQELFMMCIMAMTPEEHAYIVADVPPGMRRILAAT